MLYSEAFLKSIKLIITFSVFSPDYPTSLPNDTLTCTLKIEHVSLATTNNAGGNCQNDTTEDDQNNDNSDNNVEEICQVRLDFLDFDLQPPILGNCHYDKMWVTANGKYPLLCGHNTGQHMYLDVSGKSHTELTFALDYLQPEFYSCPDRFGFLEANSRQFDSVNMFFFVFLLFYCRDFP